MPDVQMPLAFEDGRMRTALALIAGTPETFRSDFAAWLKGNWELYVAFEREAFIVVERGREHYGANTIIEYLRHQTLLADRDGEWKMNDRWTSSIARLFAMMNPVSGKLFEFRERKRDGVVKMPVGRAA